MQDFLLQSILNGALQTNYDLDITISVGGFLVSGSVISANEYMANHVLTSAMTEAMSGDEIQSIDRVPKLPDANFEDHLPEYIHLTDAQFFSGAGNAIPGHMGTCARFSIAAINGFILGRMGAGTDHGGFSIDTSKQDD